MKRVSFEVARCLKEAGYPQYFEGSEDYGYFMNGNIPKIYNHDENDCPMYYNLLCVAPTYLEVWLWLWRYKHNFLECVYKEGRFFNYKTSYSYADPEEAIEKAIEYLVKYNLIK